MESSFLGHIIKCNIAKFVYLYWNGVTWTRKVETARVMSKKEASKELGNLSPPRFFDVTGEWGPIGPHVFKL